MATATVNRIASVESNGSIAAKGKKKNRTEIILNRPMIEVVGMTIVGTSDLIVKRMSEKTQDALIKKQGKQSPKAKEAREPYQDYLESFHMMPGSTAGEKKAKYGFPASGLKKCIQTAAGRFLKDGTTLNGMIVAGSVFVLPTQSGSDLIQIIHGPSDPYMRSDPGRNPNSGGAVVIHRGAFASWSMKFQIRYNKSALSLEQIATLFMWAGFGIGLGEWRPEKGGVYGQFEVALK